MLTFSLVPKLHSILILTNSNPKLTNSLLHAWWPIWKWKHLITGTKQCSISLLILAILQKISSHTTTHDVNVSLVITFSHFNAYFYMKITILTYSAQNVGYNFRTKKPLFFTMCVLFSCAPNFTYYVAMCVRND